MYTHVWILHYMYRIIHLSHTHTSSDSRALYGLFVMATKKVHIFVLDRVRTNQMPTVGTLYENERAARLSKYANYPVPPPDFTFDVKIETEARRVRRWSKCIGGGQLLEMYHYFAQFSTHLQSMYILILLLRTVLCVQCRPPTRSYSLMDSHLTRAP